MKRTGLYVGLLIILIGILGLAGTAIYYFLYYPSLVTSPETTILSPGTTWMPMMGGNVDTRLMQNMMTNFAKSSYESNGERIYLTGVDEDGNLIIPTSAPSSFTHMWRMMRPVACVHCHGIDGKGGFTFPDGTKSADIRWKTLTSEKHAEKEKEAGEEEEEHPPFTEATFKKAVTEGIEPNGERLSAYMPRWKVSDKDLDDLIAYLKKL